jgi:DNA helicase-2/ATP-dependent DNA helicase PcrA
VGFVVQQDQSKGRDGFRPSRYQQAIFDWVAHSTGNAVVKATAGSGKTTTLVEIARRLPDDIEVCFLSFTKSIAEELQRRLPRHVPARTLHALGFRALKDAYPELRRVEVDKHKYSNLAANAVHQLARAHGMDEMAVTQARDYLRELVKHALQSLTDPADVAALRQLALRYNLTPPSQVEIEKSCLHAVDLIIRTGTALPLSRENPPSYEDMVYIPVTTRMPFPQFDFVLVDEAQDLNPMQLEFALRAVRDHGRAVFVGDQRQSIYGFAGADTEAIPRIIHRTNATVLPLSISYRCPRSHVRLARRIAPEIEWRPDAPEGRVDWLREEHFLRWIRPGDMVLCRYNAPLVRKCLELIRQKKPAVIRGRALGEELVRLVRQALGEAAPPPHRIIERIRQFAKTVLQRLETQYPDTAVRERVAEQKKDLFEAVEVVVQGALQAGLQRPAELTAHIEHLFREDNQAVVFSTVHQAKGHEADRVFILYPERMIANCARTEASVRGEECVQFVALTRARSHLIFVEGTQSEEEWPSPFPKP